MVKIDLAPHVLQGHRARPVLNLQRRVQNIQHPLRAGHGLLHALQQVGQAGHRPVEKGKIQQKGHHIRHPEPFLIGQHAAEGHHQHRAHGGNKFH